MFHSFCYSSQLYIDATEVLKGQEKLEKTSFFPRFDRCFCLSVENSQPILLSLSPFPVNQSVSLPTLLQGDNLPLNPTRFWRPVIVRINGAVTRAVGQSVSQSVRPSVRPSVHPSINQSVSQLAGQSLSPSSICLSVSPCCRYFRGLLVR